MRTDRKVSIPFKRESVFRDTETRVSDLTAEVEAAKVSIPFKRESVFRVVELFQFYPEMGILFQFPSNGKVYSEFRRIIYILNI